MNFKCIKPNKIPGFLQLLVKPSQIIRVPCNLFYSPEIKKSGIFANGCKRNIFQERGKDALCLRLLRLSVETVGFTECAVHI